ncbi:hypothetical protein MMC07_001763 [Pseudocyphellaria aurata]|nr:hypothetical protein [Pseudocyphellaria aurata]
MTATEWTADTADAVVTTLSEGGPGTTDADILSQPAHMAGAADKDTADEHVAVKDVMVKDVADRILLPKGTPCATPIWAWLLHHALLPYQQPIQVPAASSANQLALCVCRGRVVWEAKEGGGSFDPGGTGRRECEPEFDDADRRVSRKEMWEEGGLPAGSLSKHLILEGRMGVSASISVTMTGVCRGQEIWSEEGGAPTRSLTNHLILEEGPGARAGLGPMTKNLLPGGLVTSVTLDRPEQPPEGLT